MQILIATHNPHKVDEFRAILKKKEFEVNSLNDIGFHKEIVEDGNTMEENAMIKARTLRLIYEGTIVGEDSGLEIKALDNQPGIFTARYAGPEKDPIANMQKVLRLLEGVDDRSAQFRTVIALIHENKEYYLQGVVKGKIALSMKGDHGFGYDPIFIPNGFEKTFAELGSEIKDRISHRYRAINKLQQLLLNEEN